MLTQPLLDKLTQLRLSAFRAGLEEQLGNPQYAELSFEDRLGLLVDRECTHRDGNRLQRRLKAAGLHLPATIEDLDLSPARGLDRRHVLQLLEHVPEAWNREVNLPTPKGEVEHVPIGFVIQMQGDHVFHHVERIRSIIQERTSA